MAWTLTTAGDDLLGVALLVDGNQRTQAPRKVVPEWSGYATGRTIDRTDTDPGSDR
jgi:hypothetical protein